MDKPFALIIEDDRDIAALFRHVLDIAGYRTEIAMHGRDALVRLKTSPPDIVLLDLTLPGVPGAKIIESVRGDPRLENIPVVVVTAHSRVAESLPVEPDLVLLKPVNLSQLSDLVQRLRQTAVSMVQSPWDPTTHLYNRTFLSIRLTYALERVMHGGVPRFGVLFADLQPFAALRDRLEPDRLDMFLRETAGHLKTHLRPTDTVARLEAGLFVALIEEIPEYSVPASIAARIDLDLNQLILERGLLDGLRGNVGLVLCSAEYESVEEILGDLEIARRVAQSPNARVNYEREMLRRLRGTVWAGSQASDGGPTDP